MGILALPGLGTGLRSDTKTNLSLSLMRGATIVK
jgi:hypothetical protein